jgi:hypothetical protein
MIDHMDAIDGDPDMDTSSAEDEMPTGVYLRYADWGPGCPLSDPGGHNIEGMHSRPD